MRRLLTGLLVILVLLALVAGGLFLARDVLQPESVADSDTGIWRNPLATVNVAAVAPDLALRSLAGEPPFITAEQALQVGELATAYAQVVFSLDVDDARRAGLLLALAGRYIEQNDAEAAAHCLRQISDIAALSPALTDLARAETLIQAGVYWQAIRAGDEARRNYDQAFGVAAGSRTLQPAQRRQVFLRLADEYRLLGDAQRAEEAARMANIARAPEPDAGMLGLALDGLYGEMALSDEVTALIVERKARAFRIVEILSQDLTADVTPEAADLGEFLRREGAARQAWYAEAGNHPDLSRRASVAREHMTWLAVKLRVAQRGYGLSLVPEWEADVAGIRASLNAIITEWARSMEAQLLSLSDAQQTRLGELELWRVQVLWGRLGLYPDYPADALARGMLDAVETLRLHGQLGGLLLEATGEGETLRFRVLENP